MSKEVEGDQVEIKIGDRKEGMTGYDDASTFITHSNSA